MLITKEGATVVDPAMTCTASWLCDEIRKSFNRRMKGFWNWRWHLDEMYVKINGEMHYLWRAVDQEGEIFESYVTKTRDKKAALAFIKRR